MLGGVHCPCVACGNAEFCVCLCVSRLCVSARTNIVSLPPLPSHTAPPPPPSESPLKHSSRDHTSTTPSLSISIPSAQLGVAALPPSAPSLSLPQPATSCVSASIKLPVHTYIPHPPPHPYPTPHPPGIQPASENRISSGVTSGYDSLLLLSLLSYFFSFKLKHLSALFSISLPFFSLPFFSLLFFSFRFFSFFSFPSFIILFSFLFFSFCFCYCIPSCQDLLCKTKQKKWMVVVLLFLSAVVRGGVVVQMPERVISPPPLFLSCLRIPPHPTYPLHAALPSPRSLSSAFRATPPPSLPPPSLIHIYPPLPPIPLPSLPFPLPFLFPHHPPYL